MRFLFVLILFFQVALFSNKPTVLVTGGAGYIGSHACKALYDEGFTPVVYDSFLHGSKELVKWGPFVEGDVCDFEKLDQVFQKYKPIAVMHFAGMRDIGESLSNPALYYRTNVAGTVTLLEVMRKWDVKRIIFSSTCTVYGDVGGKVMSEELSHNPSNPYSKSKSMAEKVIEDFSSAYGFTYMILRYFNAAGVDSASGLKRNPLSMGFLIPAALQKAKRGEELLVFGKNYPTRDGTAIRDYIHVSDLAHAHVLALKHLLNKKPSYALNLGTGNGYSVLEVAKAVGEVLGKNFGIKIMPSRDGDLAETVADPSLAKQVLEFTPKHSDLKTIIQSEWESMKSD